MGSSLHPSTPHQNQDAYDEEISYIDDYFSDEPGSLPGTLTIPENARFPKIILIDYNVERATRTRVPQPETCINYLEKDSVSWVDVQGLGSEEILQRLGRVFKLHPLVLEDVVNVPQRPKVEDYHHQLLLITRMVTPTDNERGFMSEQVSFILGPHYLLTVQEEHDVDTFHHVRDRIRFNRGQVRQRGADYLAYVLLDTIIDGFFPVLEDYGERLEALEDEVVMNPDRHTLEAIYDLKRELLALRRAIWPQRDALNILIRDGDQLISEDVRVYLRDCYDHAAQVMDMVESYRELASGLMDVYLSSVGHRMNEVMKLLTVVSGIFIPLTFLTGLYGMNFQHMPELDWRWSYPILLFSMGAIASGLVIFFWKRGWFEDGSPTRTM
ncbi:MAG: magnesium/cobalt transporter CorA [Merismopedia sp. SIO2A8]|nr:magnesium/cobalt transporter CorA [Symploca sp. SIO2B6]NET51438.1 magnesium/cobalt transporter CorA [Merismopedia sp. SIO2A8]